MAFVCLDDLIDNVPDWNWWIPIGLSDINAMKEDCDDGNIIEIIIIIHQAQFWSVLIIK